MAAPTPPTITISPAAAQVSGCSASCTISGPTIDSFGNELYECSFAATAHGNYNFVRFTWRQSKIVYHKADGTTTDESFDVLTTNNPTNPADNSANIGVTESRFTKTTWDVINVTAYFEEIPTYTITTASSPVGGGTTTGDGTYESGAIATLTVTPNLGYIISYWQKNGITISGSQRRLSIGVVVSGPAAYTAVCDYVGTINIAIQAHAFGLVHVVGDSAPPSAGPIVTTITQGGLFRAEAIEQDNATFKYWQSSGGQIYQDRILEVAPTFDATFTAYFERTFEAHARLRAEFNTTCPNGEVKISADGRETGWGRDVIFKITNNSRVTIEARSTGGGWSFIRWQYKEKGSIGWDVNPNMVINFQASHWGNDYYALFERTPTNLLVNSSKFASPAMLVYDDRPGATSKLIGDY